MPDYNAWRKKRDNKVMPHLEQYAPVWIIDEIMIEPRRLLVGLFEDLPRLARESFAHGMRPPTQGFSFRCDISFPFYSYP